MDVERAVLKAGVTLAAMFAVYQGTQGMQEFAKQRSEKASQEAQTLQIEREKKERAEGLHRIPSCERSRTAPLRIREF